MKQASTIDVLLLILLGAIWGSSFFNIKIATHSYEPFALATIRVFFATVLIILIAIGLYTGELGNSVPWQDS